MITVHVEKLYRYPRIAEHLTVAVPFKQGELTDVSRVQIKDEQGSLPIQCKTTAKYPDGSVKYLLVRFQGDLPANAGKEFTLEWAEEVCENKSDMVKLQVKEIAGGYQINNGGFYFKVKHDNEGLFDSLYDGKQLYEGTRFAGPLLECRENEAIMDAAKMSFGTWEIAEAGPLCIILKIKDFMFRNQKK